jgi:hypothetical protein
MNQFLPIKYHILTSLQIVVKGNSENDFNYYHLHSNWVSTSLIPYSPSFGFQWEQWTGD